MLARIVGVAVGVCVDVEGGSIMLGISPFGVELPEVHLTSMKRNSILQIIMNFPAVHWCLTSKEIIGAPQFVKIPSIHSFFALAVSVKLISSSTSQVSYTHAENISAKISPGKLSLELWLEPGASPINPLS